MRKLILTFLIIILSPVSSFALKSELTANELVQYCEEVDKGSVGSEFDRELALMCKGYMAAFFDSMIIVENLTGKPPFCISNSLPKSQNNMILKSWARKNEKIASQTTAAVALFAAFKTAFPCKRHFSHPIFSI